MGLKFLRQGAAGARASLAMPAFGLCPCNSHVSRPVPLGELTALLRKET
jgi:hypothetical protein